MLSKSTFDFLKSIKKNNNKEWFDKHKDDYLRAKDDIHAFVDDLLKEITAFDKSFTGMTAKESVFRIYRDVRFSKDKRPYKHNMGASMNSEGKKSMGPGYYLHVEPGGSFLAGGMWMPPGDLIKKIRQEIDYNGKNLKKVLENKSFKSYYKELDKSYQLKTTPKGYAKDHPDIDLLRFNSFIAWKKFDDKFMLNKNAAKELGKGAKIMKPLLDFLKEAIS